MSEVDVGENSLSLLKGGGGGYGRLPLRATSIELDSVVFCSTWWWQAPESEPPNPQTAQVTPFATSKQPSRRGYRHWTAGRARGECRGTIVGLSPSCHAHGHVHSIDPQITTCLYVESTRRPRHSRRRGECSGKTSPRPLPTALHSR